MSKIAEGYKQTEVGVIPRDWEVKKLGDLVDKFVNGGTPSTKVSDYWKGEIPWITGADILNQKIFVIRRYISREAVKNSTTNIIEKNTLLLVSRTGVGKLAITPFDVAISQDFTGVYTKKSALDTGYLFRYLDFAQKELTKQNQGTSIQGITREALASIPIPLPRTKAEQTAIATALNDADALITQLEKLIAKKRNIKQGAMQELLRPKEGWKVKRLGEILKSAQLGGNYPNSEKCTAFPLIKMGNIQRSFISTNKIEYIIENYKAEKKDRLKYGDLLFNTRNTLELVGKVSIWRNELQEAYFNSNLMRLEFNPEFVSSNFFMNYMLNTQYSLSRLKDIATGTTSVAAIYTRDFVNIEIPLPKIETQTRIAQILSDMDAEIEALEKKLEKYKMLKQGMMQNLLTGRVRLI